MTQTIAGERYQQTLGYLLVTPAWRLPLFLGRAVPVIINGFFVGVFALVVGGAILRIDVPASAYAPLALVTAVAAYSCTGLGLINAALGLLIRETAVLSNVIFGLLLIFTGANVPMDDLPEWMQSVAQVLPFTHAIEAAREVADGVPFSEVSGLVATEAAIGTVYVVAGYLMLRWIEIVSRRRATLEKA